MSSEPVGSGRPQLLTRPPNRFREVVHAAGIVSVTVAAFVFDQAINLSAVCGFLYGSPKRPLCQASWDDSSSTVIEVFNSAAP